MSDSVARLRQQIDSAEVLESVVSTMKAMASSSIGQYEAAVHSLDDYYRTVQLGLAACFQQSKSSATILNSRQNNAATGVIVFGSDQGLVGQFNVSMVDFVVETCAALPGEKKVWAVGERIQSRLSDTKLATQAGFILPSSVNAIAALVGEILIEMEKQQAQGAIEQVHLFYHRLESGSVYTPVSQQLLPLDETWRKNLMGVTWPTGNLPEVMPQPDQTLRALVREYLFVSLFRACAESLASENASRLAAMDRAKKNIDELLGDLNRTFHRLRQSSIDEELFDVLAGFEALN